MTRVEGLVLEGFDWDDGNKEKNWKSHKVTFWECEQVFLNVPIKLFEDSEHSKTEKRFVAYGQTNSGRELTIIFTMRKHKIRVISAREQNKKEAKVYEQI